MISLTYSIWLVYKITISSRLSLSLSLSLNIYPIITNEFLPSSVERRAPVRWEGGGGRADDEGGVPLSQWLDVGGRVGGGRLSPGDPKGEGDQLLIIVIKVMSACD